MGFYSEEDEEEDELLRPETLRVPVVSPSTYKRARERAGMEEAKIQGVSITGWLQYPECQVG